MTAALVRGVGLAPRRPGPWEQAVGHVTGLEPAVALPSPLPAGPAPALDDAVRRARGDRPCVVAFSGGRDSSLVLAAAVRTARADGLPDPLPVTFRYPGRPETREDGWQRAVLEHLGLRERVVLESDGEHDLLGPAATRFLSEHGAVLPASATVKRRLYEVVPGAAVLTGEGGDEALKPARAGAVRLVRDPRRPRARRTAFLLAEAVAPRSVRRRRALARWEASGTFGWLRPAARAAFFSALAQDEAAVPTSYPAYLAHQRRRSAAVQVEQTMRWVASLSDCSWHAPLLDQQLLATLAAHYGRFGPVSRSDVTLLLAGPDLPLDVVERRDKVDFLHVYFGDATREFARRWSGRGLDDELVDAERLRAEWLSPRPHPASSVALQAAWLADEGR